MALGRVLAEEVGPMTYVCLVAVVLAYVPTVWFAFARGFLLGQWDALTYPPPPVPQRTHDLGVVYEYGPKGVRRAANDQARTSIRVYEYRPGVTRYHEVPYPTGGG